MNICNSHYITKAITPISISNKAKRILNFNNSMYKYKKDSLNIENAKSYMQTSKENNSSEIEAYKIISKETKINTNHNYNDYSYLINNSKLKSVSNNFKSSNDIKSCSINYLSAELLLQASYLNSIYASPHIAKDNMDEE